MGTPLRPSNQRSRARVVFVLVAAALLAALVVGCSEPDPTPGGEDGGASTPTPTATSTSTPPRGEDEPGGSETPIATPTETQPSPTETSEPTETPATETATPQPQAQIRQNLLSNLTIGLDPGSSAAALEQIEVVTQPLDIPDRNVWVAVTSGTGIFELPESRGHIAGVYELAGENWVELAHLTLESAPTFADLEVVTSDYAGAAWIAVHGSAGAHGGTFELLRFSGGLSSALWWFSSMPGAASVVDLDSSEPPEIVLNATDPYVYCYACGVRTWSEVIYRWEDGVLMEVPLAAVPSEDPEVSALTQQAASYAQADLWRRAMDAARQALSEAPNDRNVWWLHTLVSRIADARLSDAGAPQQPFLTNILAGEYEAAVALMRPYVASTALAPDGPLIAGTVAEDSPPEVTAAWVLDFTGRAIAAAPDLDEAHAARAFGLLLQNPNDWAGALAEMEAALALSPEDAFYQEAVAYLLQQAGAAGG